jgi:hypothetical protein
MQAKPSIKVAKPPPAAPAKKQIDESAIARKPSEDQTKLESSQAILGKRKEPEPPVPVQ